MTPYRLCVTMAEKKAAATTILVLLSLVVTGAKADLTSFASETEDINARFIEAVSQQDAEAASQLWTEDCIMMPTGRDAIHGKEGLKMFFRDIFQMGVASLASQIDELGPPDATDTLYQRSHYTFFDRDGNIMEKGKAVVVWKKVTGEWRFHILIFNSHPAKSGDALKEEIDALRKQITDVWEEQDAEGVASVYSCDGKFMPPGTDVVHGKEAITGFVKMMFGMGLAHLGMDAKEITTMGASEDSLYERGYYTFSSAEGDVIDYGKYLCLMKKVDGQWKVYVAIFNSNTPVPPKSHDEL